MARYRKYDVRISLDERVRRLTPMEPSGEALWYYILSMPESSMVPGLSRVGRAALAEARKWSLEGFDKAFGELFREGLAKADWEARVVWIPNVVLYDPPSNPNVVLGWAAHWDEIPDCEIKSEAWHRFHAYFTDLAKSKKLESKRDTDPEAFLKAFLKACPKPLAKGSLNGSPNPRAPARIRKQEQDTDTGAGVEEGESHASAPPREDDPAAAKPRNGKKPAPNYPDIDTLVTFLERYPSLDTERIREALRSWLVVAQDDGNAVSAAFMVQQLKQCASWGPDRALAALENSANRRLRFVGEPFQATFQSSPKDDGRRAAGGRPEPPPSRSIRAVDRLAAFEAAKAGKESPT